MASWRSAWAPWWTVKASPETPCPRSGAVHVPKILDHVKPPKRKQSGRKTFQAAGSTPKYSSVGHDGGWKLEKAPQAQATSREGELVPRGLRPCNNPVPAARSRLPWNASLHDPKATAARVNQCNDAREREARSLAGTPEITKFSRSWRKHGGAASVKHVSSATARSAGIPPPASAGALGPGFHNGEGFSHQLLSCSHGVLGRKQIILTPGLAERVFHHEDRSPSTALLKTRHGAMGVESRAKKKSILGSIPAEEEPPKAMHGSTAFQCMGLFPDLKFFAEHTVPAGRLSV